MYISMSNMMGYQAAWNLNASSARLSESIMKLTSGLRVQKPSDGTYEYIRGNKLQADIKSYQLLQTSLSEYKSVFAIAGSAAAEIRSTLNSMMDLATQASDAAMPAAQRSALSVQFQALRTSIDNTVKSTNYEGGAILTAAGSYNGALTIALRPDRSITMAVDLNFLDVLWPAGVVPNNNINITNVAWGSAANAATAATQVATAQNTVDMFINQVSGVEVSMDHQMNINDSIIENYSAAKSSLLDINVAEETANYAALDVQNQAAIAMLSQANISHRSLLHLYSFNYS